MVIIYRYSELTSRRIKIFTKLEKGKITSVIFTDFPKPFKSSLIGFSRNFFTTYEKLSEKSQTKNKRK